jgi:hypothetical protein
MATPDRRGFRADKGEDLKRFRRLAGCKQEAPGDMNVLLRGWAITLARRLPVGSQIVHERHLLDRRRNRVFTR